MKVGSYHLLVFMCLFGVTKICSLFYSFAALVFIGTIYYVGVSETSGLVF